MAKRKYWARTPAERKQAKATNERIKRQVRKDRREAKQREERIETLQGNQADKNRFTLERWGIGR